MDTKPTSGAGKTPHRGQLRDSPAQETMDQDGVGGLNRSVQAMKTNKREARDNKKTVGHVGRFT